LPASDFSPAGRPSVEADDLKESTIAGFGLGSTPLTVRRLAKDQSEIADSTGLEVVLSLATGKGRLESGTLTEVSELASFFASGRAGGREPIAMNATCSVLTHFGAGPREILNDPLATFSTGGETPIQPVRRVEPRRDFARFPPRQIPRRRPTPQRREPTTIAAVGRLTRA
jgi:hypothetical protein